MPQRLVTRIGKVVTRSICLYLSNPSHIVCKQCLHMDYLRDPSSVSDFLCLRSFCTYLVYIYNICARVFKYIYIIYIYIHYMYILFLFLSLSLIAQHTYPPKHLGHVRHVPQKKNETCLCVFFLREANGFFGRGQPEAKRETWKVKGEESLATQGFQGWERKTCLAIHPPTLRPGNHLLSRWAMAAREFLMLS